MKLLLLRLSAWSGRRRLCYLEMREFELAAELELVRQQSAELHKQQRRVLGAIATATPASHLLREMRAGRERSTL